MGRRLRIEKFIKGHDPKLFCVERDAMITVYREGYAWEPYEFGDSTIYFLRPAHHYVFSLTDNWRKDGKPVEWGLLPILNRLKAIDLWNRDLAGEVISQTEKYNETFERDKRNSIESFFYEFRSQFKKVFSDTNVSNLEKRDRRREREKVA